MKRSEILTKRMNRLKAKQSKLMKRAMESTDAVEVRSINEQLEELNSDIEDLQDEIDVAKEEEEERSAPPANATRVNDINAEGQLRSSTQITTEKRDADPFGSLEYRQAFMKYAQTGEKIPDSLAKRDGIPANTDSLGATIPTTVLNEFINEVKLRYGNLYSKVRKMNVAGAVKIPIAKLQASFKWINENTVSPRQDAGTINDYVEFSYNMAEIRVSQTLLSSIVTLDIFEREVVNVMVIAYLQAMDVGIVKGTGNGQMLGIINDPRVIATGNVVEMTAAQFSNWTEWRKRFFAKLPLGYRDGEFIFPLSTVDTYLETMADNNNNPIFKQASGLEVNDGDAANPNGRFFGRNISLVEPDVISDFDSASDGDVVGIFWQPYEYAINTNGAFGMRRYFDEERNEFVNKMLTIVDGKVLNPKGIWLIKKKA